MRERHTRNLLTKSEVCCLSGSGDGATVKKNPLMNVIIHLTHYPVAVRDIFDCTGHMERNPSTKAHIFDFDP